MTLSTLIEEVETRAARGESFADIEEAINDLPASGPEKDALWLLAWSLRDPRHAQTDAKLHLAMVSD